MKQLKKVTLILTLGLCGACNDSTEKVEKSISSNDNQKAENNLAEKPNSTSGAPESTTKLDFTEKTPTKPIVSPPEIPLAKLLTLEPEQVPERVRVTDLKIGISRATNRAVDAEVYILDSIPSGWKLHGKGKLSVSDKYSNAGKKSVRWDFKDGDVLRIKNFGILTMADTFRNDQQPFVDFAASAFIETELPKDSEFTFYWLDHLSKNPEDDWMGLRKTIKATVRDTLTVPSNFSGTWFSLAPNFADKDMPKRTAKFDNKGKIIPGSESFPAEWEPPAENELLIVAPTEVASGSIYLDRFLVVASRTQYSQEDAKEGMDPTKIICRTPVTTIKEPKLLQPLPEHFLNKIPQSLTPEQQAWVDGLRAAYYPTERSKDEITDKNSGAYKEVERRAQALLDALFIELPDGSCKIKDEVNYSGARVFFKGDLYFHRKFTVHIPTQLANGEKFSAQEHMIDRLEMAAKDYMVRCPDSPVVQNFFKAFFDWHAYQFMNGPYVPAPGGKYGYQIEKDKPLISTLKTLDGYHKYIDYFSRLAISEDVMRLGVHWEKDNPYWSTEFPNAPRVFDSMIAEPDDRKLYAMLTHYRDNLKWYWSISSPGKQGMIKPDYSFFHHGIVSYWGAPNHGGIIETAHRYLNSPLDPGIDVHRSLSNWTPRLLLSGTVGPLKGSQNFAHRNEDITIFRNRYMEDPEWMAEQKEKAEALKGKTFSPSFVRTVEQIEEYPSAALFKYYYELDWGKVPEAKKNFQVILRALPWTPQETKDKLFDKWPKLREIQPMETAHISFNYTGVSMYFHKHSGVGVGSYKSMPNRVRPKDYSWVKQFGVMDVLEWNPDNRIDSRGKVIAANPYGYDYTKTPGITIPEIHTARGEDLTQTGFFDVSKATGNGSLSFNETVHDLPKYGNYSFRIQPHIAAKKWAEYDVADFQGLKSYHFFEDQVVALGSDLQAKTSRPMQTVLFQEMTDFVPWLRSKDHSRWNPDEPTLVHNGKSYTKGCSVKQSLADGGYLVSPYGHAYLVPAGQQGTLDIDWKKRSLPNSGLTKFPGQYTGGTVSFVTVEREGTGAMARILQDSSKPSFHHYCLLLNSDGKSPEEIETHAQENLENPRYKVLKQDAAAHAIEFKGETDSGKLLSYIVFEPDTPLGLPIVDSANRSINLMMQRNKDGDLTVSISDPEIYYDNLNGIERNNYDRDGHVIDREVSGYNKEDPRNLRTVKVKFTENVELLEARSGLPESNPNLNAKIEDGNRLVFQTRDGVSDTFLLKISK